jgi:ABC-type transport system involved in cytochrome bd biosynthesis fused ATPase/permease subunit
VGELPPPPPPPQQQQQQWSNFNMLLLLLLLLLLLAQLLALPTRSSRVGRPVGIKLRRGQSVSLENSVTQIAFARYLLHFGGKAKRVKCRFRASSARQCSAEIILEIVTCTEFMAMFHQCSTAYSVAASTTLQRSYTRIC